MNLLAQVALFCSVVSGVEMREIEKVSSALQPTDEENPSILSPIIFFVYFLIVFS